MRTTTLAKIKKFHPCVTSWEKLLHGLGKTRPDDEVLSYSRILTICGLNDAIWAARTEDDYNWVQRLAINYARHVEHLATDPRSVAALNVAEQYLDGTANREKLWGARDNAHAAAYTLDAASAFSIYYATCATCAYDSVCAVDATFHTAYYARSSIDKILEMEWQEQEFLMAVS
jgi:hypothetical protein